MTPLVSCIMPTANRRRFVPLAIRCFLAQDYPEKELLILDDGEDSVADLVPEDARIRYLRAERRRPLGAKRNECVAAARGDLIMHWDDDDWMAPRRIRCQVELLLNEGAEICGLRRMLFHNLATGQTWLYQYPPARRLWLAGGSLLYTRDFWRRSDFPGVQTGEDARFLWNRPPPRAAVAGDHDFYVAMIHAGNTSAKRCRGPYWSPSPADLAGLMGPDLDLYRSAVSAAPSPPGENPMKLNLGCCDAVLPGFTNVDAVAAPGVDQVADLARPWPWPDDSADHVRAWDVIEHLPDKIHTMNELWRVLRPGGRAEIALPTTDGPGAFQDPTHVSFWNRRSFLYYQAGNPYRERFARHYGIRAKFRVVSERSERGADGPRLIIVLEALKP